MFKGLWKKSFCKLSNSFATGLALPLGTAIASFCISLLKDKFSQWWDQRHLPDCFHTASPFWVSVCPHEKWGKECLPVTNFTLGEFLLFNVLRIYFLKNTHTSTHWGPSRLCVSSYIPPPSCLLCHCQTDLTFVTLGICRGFDFCHWGVLLPCFIQEN